MSSEEAVRRRVFELLKQLRVERAARGGERSERLAHLEAAVREAAGSDEQLQRLSAQFEAAYRQNLVHRRREKMLHLSLLCAGFLHAGRPLPGPLVRMARHLGGIRHPSPVVPGLAPLDAGGGGGGGRGGQPREMEEGGGASRSKKPAAKRAKKSDGRAADQRRAKLAATRGFAPSQPAGPSALSLTYERERKLFLEGAPPPGLSVVQLQDYYRQKLLYMVPAPSTRHPLRLAQDQQQIFLQAIVVRARQMEEAWHDRADWRAWLANDIRDRAAETERKRMRQLKTQDLNQYLEELRARNDDRIQVIVKQTQACLAQIMGSLALYNRRIFADQQPEENIEHALRELIFAKAKEVRVPIGLGGGSESGLRLKSYQVDGLKWLVSLDEYNLNGILADEMGLGKTVQTIAFMLYLRENNKVSGQHLVVAPMAVVPNWLDQFEMWAPQIRVAHWTARVPIAERAEYFRETVRKADVVVTTYDWIREHQTRKSKEKWGIWPHLNRLKWHLVVVDEGHHIANNTSQVSKALRQLSCRRKMILTGTPLQNSLTELWALLNYLMPQVFENDRDFEEWFAAPFAGEEKAEMTDEEKTLVILRLHKVLAPFMLRRVKQDVASELPDVVERVLPCDLSEFQLMMLNYVRKGQVPEVPGQQRKQIMSSSAGMMRKVCNHPLLVYSEMGSSTTFPWEVFHEHFNLETFVQASGKFVMLDVLLQKLKLGRHRVLVYSPWTQTLELLSKMMELRGHSYRMLTGATNGDDRERIIQEFSDDESVFVFLVSTHAGGEGVNLQAADTVIVFESDWNPQKDKQAKARVHRIGQKKKVLVLTLISVGEDWESHDQKKFMRAEEKRKMEEKVIGAGNFVESTTDRDRADSVTKLLESDGSGPNYGNTKELDRLLARSDAEYALLQKNPIIVPPLLSKAHLPDWFVNPPKKQRASRGAEWGSSQRRRTVKSYKEVGSDGEVSSELSDELDEEQQQRGSDRTRRLSRGLRGDGEDDDELGHDDNGDDDDDDEDDDDDDDDDVHPDDAMRRLYEQPQDRSVMMMGDDAEDLQLYSELGTDFLQSQEPMMMIPPPQATPIPMSPGPARAVFHLSMDGHAFDQEMEDLPDDLDLDAFE